uniref:Uncharacterized protein LOC102808727 n=1 Tax=Saccoglossus kowalevskii TaxID=10224 RepID=A0ABM0MN25_SACKO
ILMLDNLCDKLEYVCDIQEEIDQTPEITTEKIASEYAIDGTTTEQSPGMTTETTSTENPTADASTLNEYSTFDVTTDGSLELTTYSETIEGNPTSDATFITFSGYVTIGVMTATVIEHTPTTTNDVLTQCMKTEATISGTASRALAFDACSLGPFDSLANVTGIGDYTADMCGACLEVTGTNGVCLNVMVADSCGNCGSTDLLLSETAYNALLGTVLDINGYIDVFWRPVPCVVTGYMMFQFSIGSTSDAWSLLIKYHRYPIAAVCVYLAKDCINLPRLQWSNYFDKAWGLGNIPAPFMLRITSDSSHDVYFTIEDIDDSVIIESDVQFPV